MRAWFGVCPLIAGIALWAGAGEAARASTTIPGGNIINQTWTPAGSPYIVQGDITIPAGAFLTVQAGTTVVFPASDSQVSGLDSSHVEITVNGTLSVAGTAVSPVNFQAQSGTAAGTWYGIVVGSGAASASISHASIRHAVYGVRSSASGTILVLSDSSVTTCSQAGANIAAGAPLLSRLAISAAPVGVTISGTAAPTLANCFVYGNTSYGVQITSIGNIAINNCTISGNGTYGVYDSAASPGAVSVFNSIVVNQTGYGLYRAGTATFAVGYSDVWNNATANFFGVTPGAGVMSANPMLASSSDPHLLAGSVCIDTGDSAHCSSPDVYGQTRPVDGDGIGGAACDMGAVEYVPCSSPSIGAHPAGGAFLTGSTITLSVTATGTGLNYQWRRNGVNVGDVRGVTGSTTATLTLPGAGTFDAGTYDVVVTNACNSATSNPAVVTLSAACPSDLDDGSGSGLPDGGTDINDLLFFLAHYEGGC